MSDRCDGLHEPAFDLSDDTPPSSWQPAHPIAPAQVSAPTALADARFDLGGLAEWLPRLGATLWMDRKQRGGTTARSSGEGNGVCLIEHPALAPLVRCATASAHTLLTPQGPREWLCFRDREGMAQAKLFLLPDTDYLAWDEMSAAMLLAPAPPEPERWQAHNAFLHQALARLHGNWQARLLIFEHTRLPWMRLLGAKPPLRISLLGLEFARVIARADGADLVSPLHAA